MIVYIRKHSRLPPDFSRMISLIGLFYCCAFRHRTSNFPDRRPVAHTPSPSLNAVRSMPTLWS